MRLAVILLALAAVMSAQPPRDRKRDSENPLAGKMEALSAGQKRFMVACVACHGQNGEGGRGPNLAEGRAVTRGSDSLLFASIQKGLPGTDMPPFPLPDAQVWELVAYVRSLSAPAFHSPVQGNAENGESIFYGKGSCTNCHMIRSRGGYLGPDLSSIGLMRPYRLLREAVLEPSKRLTEGYQGVTVTTGNGQMIKGVCKNNTNYSIQVMDAKGDLHLLEKQNLTEVVFKKGSLMPGDYGKRLTPSEVDDLLAFLSRQSMREK